MARGDAHQAVGQPVRLEIVAYAPTDFFHCLHCEVVWDHIGLGRAVHSEQRDSALPAELREEYARIVDWVNESTVRYGDRLRVKVVDAASVEGVARAVRHRLRRFPAFVVNGAEKVIGFDPERLEAVLERRLAGEEHRPRRER